MAHLPTRETIGRRESHCPGRIKFKRHNPQHMIELVTRLSKRARTLRDATRVWNLIDRQSEPEPLWAILEEWVPWAFSDYRNYTSIEFCYSDDELNRKKTAAFKRAYRLSRSHARRSA